MADDFREPESLRRDLRSLYEPGFAVPSRVDDAIRNRARAQLARHGRLRIFRWTGSAAAVACIVLVGRVVLQSPVLPDDIDRNHRVDIVDALKLARQIESGKGRDINGDGVIDSRDVDAIAMVAVRIEGSVQ